MTATAVGLILTVLAVNVFTFAVFAYDKARAIRTGGGSLPVDADQFTSVATHSRTWQTMGEVEHDDAGTFRADERARLDLESRPGVQLATENHTLIPSSVRNEVGRGPLAD